jgi:hypothetical protein
MQKRLMLLLFLGLFLIWVMQITGTKAQDLAIDDYPEWLQALDIQFGEGLEILAGDFEANAPNSGVQSFGDVEVDYLNLRLTLADKRMIDLPSHWAGYGRPQALRLEERLLWFEPNWETSIYTIELDTGTISSSETVSTPCGEQGDFLASWVVTQMDEEDYFCELSTGELVGPILFDNSQAGLVDERFISPDGRILAMNVDYVGILLFNTESREWRIVPEISLPYLYSSQADMKWIEDSRYLLIRAWNQGNRNSGQAYAWIIDIETSEIIHRVGTIVEDDGTRTNTRVNTLPYIEENPLRLVTEYAHWDESSFSYSHCFIDIFYLESHEQEHIDYGGLCYFKTGDLLGIGYFLERIQALEPATTSYRREVFREGITALLRHDASTGLSEVIYAGAIEDVIRVSPDEHYALLRLSNDDTVHRAFAEDIDFGEYAARLVLIDLTNDEILYEEPSVWQPYPMMSWSPSAEMMQMSLSNHGWALCKQQACSFYQISEDNQLLDLGVEAYSINHIGEGWFTITNQAENEAYALQVMHTNGGTYSLLSYSYSSYPQLLISYLGDNEFSLRFSANTELIPYRQIYSFTVRIRD